MPERRSDGFPEAFAGSESGTAWRSFLDRYAGKIMGIVRQYEHAPGRSQDCFLFVCERLAENDFRRLLQFDRRRGASFGTWLATVVSRLCIDWHRMEHGRRRQPAAILRLSAFDQEVFRLRYQQHLDLGMCLQFVRIRHPDKTRADLSRSLERIHATLSPRRRWGLTLRDRPGQMEVAAGPAEEGLADGDPPPDELVAGEQERENLNRALARLSPDQQLMLRLRFQQDMRLQDIARVTGCGDLHRARRMIISALEELAQLLGKRDSRPACK